MKSSTIDGISQQLGLLFLIISEQFEKWWMVILLSNSSWFRHVVVEWGICIEIDCVDRRRMVERWVQAQTSGHLVSITRRYHQLVAIISICTPRQCISFININYTGHTYVRKYNNHFIMRASHYPALLFLIHPWIRLGIPVCVMGVFKKFRIVSGICFCFKID